MAGREPNGDNETTTVRLRKSDLEEAERRWGDKVSQKDVYHALLEDNRKVRRIENIRRALTAMADELLRRISPEESAADERRTAKKPKPPTGGGPA